MEAQEYWSGHRQPIPSPADLSDPGIELGSRALKVDSLPAELPGKPGLRDAQITGKTLFPGVSGRDEYLHQ